MLAHLAVVVRSVRVWIPPGTIVGVRMMRLVKARLVNQFRDALHANEEHRGDHQFENRVTHPHSLHNSCAQTQFEFTFLSTKKPLRRSTWPLAWKYAFRVIHRKSSLFLQTYGHLLERPG